MSKSTPSPITETTLKHVCHTVTKKNITQAINQQNKEIDKKLDLQNKEIDKKLDQQNKEIDKKLEKFKQDFKAELKAELKQERLKEREEDRKYLEQILTIKIEEKIEDFKQENRHNQNKIITMLSEMMGRFEKQDQERIIYASHVTQNRERIEKLEQKVFPLITK